MGQKEDNAKRLKAFAKRRDARVQPSAPQVPNEREQARSQCVAEIVTALCELRASDSNVRDAPAVEAFRYECREPGIRLSADNRVHELLTTLREAKQYDLQTWRAAIKSILAMSDPPSLGKSPTQLLDLLETIAH